MIINGKKIKHADITFEAEDFKQILENKDIVDIFAKAIAGRYEMLAKAVVEYDNKWLNESEGQDAYDPINGWKEIMIKCFIPALKRNIQC